MRKEVTLWLLMEPRGKRSTVKKQINWATAWCYAKLWNTNDWRSERGMDQGIIIDFVCNHTYLSCFSLANLLYTLLGVAVFPLRLLRTWYQNAVIVQDTFTLLDLWRSEYYKAQITMADNASSNDDGLKPLTVDAMLAKYPKPNVDKTVYNRQYTQYFRTLPVLY